MLTDHQIAQAMNARSLQGGNDDSPWWLLFARDIERAASAELPGLRELADSEGTRAVEYLRRARNAEAELERLRLAAADVVRVWSSPSWNWSHTGSAADAMNALAAALGSQR